MRLTIGTQHLKGIEMSGIKTTESDCTNANLVKPREGEGAVAFRKRQARAAWKMRQARKRERDACAGNGDGKQFKKQGRVSMICDWIKAAVS